MYFVAALIQGGRDSVHRVHYIFFFLSFYRYFLQIWKGPFKYIAAASSASLGRAWISTRSPQTRVISAAQSSPTPSRRQRERLTDARGPPRTETLRRACHRQLKFLAPGATPQPITRCFAALPARLGNLHGLDLTPSRGA